MRARTFLFALTAASSLLAARPARTEEGFRQVATCTVAGVFSPQLEEPAGRAPRFPAGRIVSIEFDVVATRATQGTHRLELRLYTPQGYLYQALPASFTVAPPAARKRAEATNVTDDALGSGVQRRRAPWNQVRLRLSVPGSPIVTHSLYGRWEARPHLDGALQPCGVTRRFWIDR